MFLKEDISNANSLVILLETIKRYYKEQRNRKHLESPNLSKLRLVKNKNLLNRWIWYLGDMLSAFSINGCSNNQLCYNVKCHRRAGTLICSK